MSAFSITGQCALDAAIGAKIYLSRIERSADDQSAEYLYNVFVDDHRYGYFALDANFDGRRIEARLPETTIRAILTKLESPFGMSGFALIDHVCRGLAVATRAGGIPKAARDLVILAGSGDLVACGVLAPTHPAGDVVISDDD